MEERVYTWKYVDRCGDCWKDRTQRMEEGIIVFFYLYSCVNS